MCSTRSFPTNEFHAMNDAVLELVNSFNDLEIIFDCFRNDMTSTVSKAKCILGFIKRWAKEFYDRYVTIVYHTALSNS